MHDKLFGLSLNDNISSIRGTPRVTLDFEATPAKWKVFNVNWVVGSPILCAAIIPTISPGATSAFLYALLIIVINNSTDLRVNRLCINNSFGLK